MTPGEFIAKWSDTGLRERAGAQSHFIDLCRVLGEKAPTDADPRGEWYAFEKGAMKTGGGDGWADVWKRGCFAWEYKSPGKDLSAALKQLQYYVRSLENPPLLIVSDMERIELHTNWTNTVQEVHTLSLRELEDARRRQLLKKAFSETEVEELKPGKTREALTKEVAEEFVKLAQNLRDRGHDPENVAHFVNRMVFCMFAEDVDLLPDRLFKRMLEASADEPESFAENAQKLFAAMARQGGRLDFKRIEWFNGGIFDDDAALPLTKADIKVALAAANRNWSSIDPSIMGTLFERGLDPGKRSQLGAHYTDPDKIMLIVNPVIVEPLTREWEEIRSKIEAELKAATAAREARPKTQKEAAQFYRAARQREENAIRRAQRHFQDFQTRLRDFRVLDPACGSGNFLYLALKSLKDIELRANQDWERLGRSHGLAIGVSAPLVGPENMLGIEINPFAAELARVSVWIGEIQWMREHGFDASRNPILKPLETIECRDALLNEDGSETEWPEADVIIGNPPFLGGKLLISYLGEDHVDRMFRAYDGRVPREADLVCYWFQKASEHIGAEKADRAGLVATNSIRGGANREVLKHARENGIIFDAWDDEPWVLDGASIRVSLVGFAGSDSELPIRLDAQPVLEIFPDLTARTGAAGVDLTHGKRLPKNRDVAFMGDTKGGAFDIDGDLAREWLQMPRNPHGKPNSDVLKPWINGLDVTRRPRDMWIIDFGWEMSEAEAALYETPFAHVREHVFPERQKNRREAYKKFWWRHVEPRPGFAAAAASRPRYLATARVAKHRLWCFVSRQTLPDSQIIAIARDDGSTFGILHSRFHELWSLRMCTWLGVGNDPRYTPTTCFETFPFPEDLTPDIPAAQYASDPRAMAIAAAAARLNELRKNWLNPPDLVQRVPEIVPLYPDRILPVDEKAAAILKKRTLTNLYNERPAWLDIAHRDLDAAVAAAYGWPADLTDEQILERLFKLNQARAS